MSVHPHDVPPPAAMPYNASVTSGMPSGMPSGISGMPTAAMQLNAGMLTQAMQPATVPVAPDAGTGLDLLKKHKKVIIQQQLDVMEAVSFIDRPNKYILMNTDDQAIMFLDEVESGMIVRTRGIDVIAKDTSGQKLFHITRPSKPCSMCPFCCALAGPCKYEGDVELYDGNGKLLGHLEQKVSFNSAKLVVEEKDGDDIYMIRGGSACCTPTTKYEIKDKHGDEVAELEKKGTGVGQGQNRWEVKFPDVASAESKALIIGLCILIDYRFHFNARRPQMRRRGRH